ncbi:uncharacterized protein LOC121767714 [Salvia splendens]|uniref:uncharacterized protein LOC121767714 n=1 Tax=Salvia splendens TaxID=180675 RepID=UPI001C2743E8|nr:uncharacterized protein LOC121767714 [Salvia splendens]
MGGKASSKSKSGGEKISSKKKGRRKESKKRSRSYDSVSSSSDDDSLYLEHRSSTLKTDHRRRLTKTSKRGRHDSPLSDSDSDSSSTDVSDYKTRRSRRSRVVLRDVKRKRRKRDISTTGDVDTTSGRKRKRSGKDHVSKPIKKSSKKNSRKVASSSLGSDSESCSLSQSRSSSSSGDDKLQRNKVASAKVKERLKHRQSCKGKQKHEDRSPSCTSIGRGGDREHFPVDNSRRLRSVITFADQPHDKDGSRWEMDPHKEEIVYDEYDYPSPRSIDSNEGGSKMEAGDQSIVSFSDRICLENVAGDKVCELGKSGIDDGDHHQSEGCINKPEEKEIDTSVPVAASGGDDLESILRQKALENLRKFRRMPQTRPRSNVVEKDNESNVATLPDRTVDIGENVPIEHGISDYQETNQRNGLLAIQREIVTLPDSEHIEEKPQMANPSITPPCNASALVECSKGDKNSYSPAAEMKAESGNDVSPGAGVTKASSSNAEPISGEHSSGQTKDSSEFEQKTMTVMRGGELVQVSYKVYIPKKAPALARRQLKRRFVMLPKKEAGQVMDRSIAVS